MTMRETIDITGLDKAAILATLFNASAPAGMGFLQAGNGPTVMTVEYAQKLIEQGTSPDYPGGFGKQEQFFDYLYGRPLKINLSNDQLDPWGFDRDNGGEGTAKRLIDELRANGTVDSDEHEQTRKALLIERSSDAMDFANKPSSMSVVDGMPTFELGGADVGDVLVKAVDREIIRQGI